MKRQTDTWQIKMGNYLDASCKSIADALKQQGAYDKSLIENLLSDSKAMARDAEEIAGATQQLDDIAAVFRDGEKKLSDIYSIVRTIEEAPWAVQKAFLAAEENADIADFVRQAHTKEFERRVFEDRVAAGEELFEKIGFTDKAEELRAIIQEICRTTDELKPVMDKIVDIAHSKGLKDLEERNSLTVLLTEYQNKIAILNKKRKYVLPEIKRRLLHHSKISHKEAVEWVNNNVDFSPSIKNMLYKFNIEHTGKAELTLDITKEELANIYRITNGKLDDIKIEGKINEEMSDRASVNRGENKIYWPKGDIRSLYHEAGHIFEFANPYFLAPAMRFIKDRATGDPQKLADLTGSSDYLDNEIVYHGKFSDPYIGKVYLAETEVLSMGLEILADEESFLIGIKDMEHLKFCFGCFISDFKEDTIKITLENIANESLNKKRAWEMALDQAISESFKNQLFAEGGFESFKIEKQIKNKNDSSEKYILKYGGETISKCSYPKEKAEKVLVRVAYLAICNLKDLIPEATSMIIERRNNHWCHIFDSEAPKWFNPLTELPRL